MNGLLGMLAGLFGQGAQQAQAPAAPPVDPSQYNPNVSTQAPDPNKPFAPAPQADPAPQGGGMLSGIGHALFGHGQATAQDPLAPYRPGLLSTAVETLFTRNPFAAQDILTRRNIGRAMQPGQMAALAQQMQIQQAKNRLILQTLNGQGGDQAAPAQDASQAQGGVQAAPPLQQQQAPPQGALPFNQRNLAALTFAGDKDAASTWDVVKPHYAIDRTSGAQFDENGGGFTGARAPRTEYVNGQRVDPYADDAPKFVGKPPVDGAEPLYDQKGNPAGWRMADGSIQAIQQAKGAEAEGTAMNTFHEVEQPSGAKVPVLGRDIPHSTPGAPGLPPIPAPPTAGAPAPGVGQTTADKSFQQEDGKNLANTILRDASSGDAARQQAADASQALTFTRTHQMDPTTPFNAELSEWARALPAPVQKNLGITGHLANDAATYERLARADTLGFSKTNLPSRYTEREMNFVTKIIPQLSAPNESASLYWAQRGALANRQAERSDLARGYKGERSTQAYENAWQNGPGAKSIFQDPIWSGVTINGKPAVTYATKGGVKYGVFNPYTPDGKPNPNGYVFRVR